MNFAMFPTDKGTSVSPYVARIIKVVRSAGFEYQLTSMGTQVETTTLEEAFQILAESNRALEPDCERVYLSVNFDIKKGEMGRIKSKIASVEEKLIK